jgi:hypothetical protein
MLWKSNWQGKAKIVSGILNNLSVLMESENKKMFKIGKVAAISGTIISTIESAQSSYSAMAGIPIVGPALGVAAAAAAVAGGMVRLQKIKAQQFNSGGSAGGAAQPAAPSDTSSGSEAPEAAQPVINRNINIGLSGGTFSQDQVRSLISEINESVDDNTTLRTS